MAMRKHLKQRFGVLQTVKDVKVYLKFNPPAETTLKTAPEKYKSNGVWITQAWEISDGGRVYIPKQTVHRQKTGEWPKQLRSRAFDFHRYVQGVHACWHLGIEPGWLTAEDARQRDYSGRRVPIDTLIGIARQRKKGEKTIQGLRHKGRSIYDWAGGDDARYQRMRRAVLRGVDIATAIEEELDNG